MSERYSRLYALQNNLYSEGAPVLIVAGALLKDNHTGKVLAQLKFRNISGQPLKYLKIRVNAYDTANENLKGVEAFSYLDLSVAANEEFGQTTPIYLPDATTRSFSVEILYATYGNGEVFSPETASVAEGAPEEILAEVQRVEDLKEAIRVEQAQEGAKKKHRGKLMLWGFASVVAVALSFFFRCIGEFYMNWLDWQYMSRWIGQSSVRYILALIAPGLYVCAALVAKKIPAVLKSAAIACSVVLAVQVISIVFYAVTVNDFDFYINHYNTILWPLERYVNGVGLIETLRFLFSGVGATRFFLLYSISSLFGIAANILPTVALFMHIRKNK